jgi:hypothetical protein
VTFKILYNSVVATTGGQDAAGAVPVPELTRQLGTEGERRILVLTDEPGKYPPEARWAPGVEVWRPDRLDETQRIFREIRGVTALGLRPAVRRREAATPEARKLADPSMRVVINELVCEGCGDCGVESNCLWVQPVETEFGRKTQIHQSSCYTASEHVRLLEEELGTRLVDRLSRETVPTRTGELLYGYARRMLGLRTEPLVVREPGSGSRQALERALEATGQGLSGRCG